MKLKYSLKESYSINKINWKRNLDNFKKFETQKLK